MMILWACAGVPLGAYNIAGNFNIAFLIQPQILTVLSLITWIQCFYYDDVSLIQRDESGKGGMRRAELMMRQKWSVVKCCAAVMGMGALFGGVETGLVFALKVRSFTISRVLRVLADCVQDAVEMDRHWAVTLTGVLSAVFLCAGVLRHYYDIWVHRTVRGISFIFVGIDAAGDVFSLVSVCKSSLSDRMCGVDGIVFQPKLDILGMAIYASEFVLWCGVFGCGGYFNLTPWVRQKLRARSQRKEAQRSEDLARHQTETEGVVSDDVALHQMSSSTSVFRTPSSVASFRGSRISLDRAGG